MAPLNSGDVLSCKVHEVRYLGRKRHAILGGTATWDEEKQHVSTISGLEVKTLRRAPLFSELRIRRLERQQTMMQDRDQHNQFVFTCSRKSALNGGFISEEGVARPYAHPRADQFQYDLEALKELGMGETTWDTGGSMKNIRSEGYEDFTKDD
eukprot:8861067-Pyramimonas_sp.AAC.1